MSSSDSTIAALATAPFPAGLAVIRVSGPKAKRALKAVFQSSRDPVSDPRRMTFGDLVDSKSNEVIGDALAVFMPGPHSYTGEDVAEFQFFGSPLLVQKILRLLFGIGINPAEPGEFTRRAFINGKIDLVQAEAIAELANATSEHALKIAGEHLKGRFSGVIEELGEPLRDTLAELEASLDFPEEEIEPQRIEEIEKTLELTRGGIETLIQTYNYGHVMREGYRVLLCGLSNVGKSSLLNMLLNKERAIVSDVSGTTRDLIEEEVILGGYRFVFCDSAGIRETRDKVEKIGVDLAVDKIEWADLVMFVVDATDQSNDWQKVLELLRGRARRIWMVTNKIDLNPGAIGKLFCESKTCAQNFYLSAKTRSGLAELTQALADEVERSLPDRAHSSQVVTNERQRNCLVKAGEALARSVEAIHNSMPLEIVSAEIRGALSVMEELIGKTYTEDILGRIFSKFCVGK